MNERVTRVQINMAYVTNPRGAFEMTTPSSEREQRRRTPDGLARLIHDGQSDGLADVA